jgi:hypothetical protein
MKQNDVESETWTCIRASYRDDGTTGFCREAAIQNSPGL